MSTVRVAACQFAIGTDVDANLRTVLRFVADATGRGAQLVVLPEFCNHPSWYRDAEHAHDVAVDLDGPFVAAVGDAARAHGAWVMLNATVRRPDGRITDTNILLDDAGVVRGTSDKQVLMGAERLHIAEGDTESPIVASPFGRLGLYSCMDGVINETPRCLALRGAQVLLNSLNSFALDEASLHVPVRAAENRVFVVAANKVGPLLPAEVLDIVSRQIGVDAPLLDGAGESQIVAPDGTVLAIAPRHGEAIVVADIDPGAADDKRRPDGTDVVAVRRPRLYAPIGEPPRGVTRTPGADVLAVAALQPGAGSDPVALVERAVAAGSQLVVLPELAAGPVDRVDAAVAAGEELITRLAAVSGDALVVTSVVHRSDAGVSHCGVVVAASGVVHRQDQLHAVARHPWVTALGAAVGVVSTAFGRLALLVGDDLVHPEAARLATLAEAEVLAVPGAVQEPWELRTGIVERAAENRLNIVLGSRRSAAGGAAIVAAQTDFTLWTEWRSPFAGSINQPQVQLAAEGEEVLLGTVHPATTANRLVSRGTDVVDGRPWRLVGAITGTPVPA